MAAISAQHSDDAASSARFEAAFRRLDAALADELRAKLQETVVALCEQTLRPLALDTEALTRRVEAAVALLVRSDSLREIRLNPEDLALIGPRLPPDWACVADPDCARGALRVEGNDGGLEDGPAQWRQALEAALQPC